MGGLGQGQGKGRGQGKGDSNGQGQGDGKGGLEAGWGSSSNTNSAPGSDAPATGEQSKLKGIQGQGPTVSKTERAEEGSGSRSGAKARLIKQYQHQAESFVRREDVSEAVKSGVKAYFESIHKTGAGN